MVNQKFKSQFTLINAPAGSGKTTSIKSYIDSLYQNNYRENSLCLTFTNRAVEELRLKIFNDFVDIYTIHEYCNQILSSFYKSNEAKTTYFEMFKENILNIINSTDQKDIDKITRYKEKHSIEVITEDIIKQNIKEIKYNQTNYSSYLNGTLSHDDLLGFIFYFSKKYPKFLDIISKKYKFIFIDEYQDTSSNILKMIYNACVKNHQYLILFGDKMQEIYNNYDGNFDNELLTFDTSKKLNINYRSSQEIVSVLNNIYNNEEYNQSSFLGLSGYKPKFIFTESLMDSCNELLNSYANALQLYIANRERFEKIGAINLFKAVGKIEDYQFGSKYEPTDILLDNSQDNPDTLIKFYFDLYNIKELLELNNFGAALRLINKIKYFVQEKFIIKRNKDKVRVKEDFNKIRHILSENSCIFEILNDLFINGYIDIEKLNNIITRQDYQDLLQCSNFEFARLYQYLSEKNISTQHGVKGESHDKVIMFIENSHSNNPNVKIYEFLELFSSIDINFEDYKKFVIQFKAITKKVNDIFDNSNKWNATNVSIYQDLLNETGMVLLSELKDNIYFVNTGMCDKIKKFLSKKTVKGAQDAFTANYITGILNAYRLFYVGCSRARKDLIIVLLEQSVKNYKQLLITKLVEVGFEELVI